MSPAVAKRQLFEAGPWKGVRATNDPFDDSTDQLVDALNCYLPDTFTGSGMYARPGFGLQNDGSQLATPGQGMHSHTSLSGTTYNLLVSGGKVYRADAALAVFTDVTPVTPTIATSGRVYFKSFNDSLIVSDGVNKPWVASSLGSTPIVGTVISYDGGATAWSAFGQPEVYDGCLFFILNSVGGTARRSDISWSNPGDPTTGYQQANYDYNWTLEQTGTTPIYALAGTNNALYYWRDKSIGALSGVPGPDFRGQATHDVISVNIGTLQSATVQQFGQSIFFCDQIGRPWMIGTSYWTATMGGAPSPIWLAMRSIVDGSTVAYPSATATVACAVIEPTLNLYIAAIWSAVASTTNPPVELQVFDARTGTYLGRWNINGGIGIEALGILNNNSGLGSLTIIGSKLQAPALGGYVWTQNALVGGGTPLETEGTLFLLTEDGLQLTTESLIPSWLDNGVTPHIYATTDRLGYSSDGIINVDSCTVVTGTNAPCTVSMQTSTVLSEVQGTPGPAASSDNTYRLVVGSDIQGRGVQVTVSPTTASSQWNLQRISITAIPSLATADEP